MAFFVCFTSNAIVLDRSSGLALPRPSPMWRCCQKYRIKYLQKLFRCRKEMAVCFSLLHTCCTFVSLSHHNHSYTSHFEVILKCQNIPRVRDYKKIIAIFSGTNTAIFIICYSHKKTIQAGFWVLWFSHYFIPKYSRFCVLCLLSGWAYFFAFLDIEKCFKVFFFCSFCVFRVENSDWKFFLASCENMKENSPFHRDFNKTFLFFSSVKVHRIVVKVFLAFWANMFEFAFDFVFQ